MGYIEFKNVKWLDGTDIEGGFNSLGFPAAGWMTFENILGTYIKAEADLEEWEPKNYPVSGHDGYYWTDYQFSNYILPSWGIEGAAYRTVSTDPDWAKNGDIQINTTQDSEWSWMKNDHVFDGLDGYDSNDPKCQGITFTIHRVLN